MKSLRFLLVLLLTLSIPSLCAAQAQPPRQSPRASAGQGTAQGTPQMKAAAQDAASRWLALVDGGRYGESWDAASPMFQRAIDKPAWQRAMQTNRAPYGNSTSRTLSSAEYTTELPGAPDGRYYLLEFKSSFEHKKSAIERVTLSQGDDGQWRVSGYFIS
jgi:uncharacterized protein DUF4019